MRGNSTEAQRSYLIRLVAMRGGNTYTKHGLRAFFEEHPELCASIDIDTRARLGVNQSNLNARGISSLSRHQASRLIEILKSAPISSGLTLLPSIQGDGTWHELYITAGLTKSGRDTHLHLGGNLAGFILHAGKLAEQAFGKQARLNMPPNATIPYTDATNCHRTLTLERLIRESTPTFVEQKPEILTPEVPDIDADLSY